MSDSSIYPFETEDGITFNFSIWKEEYFNHAATMCQMAVDYGFQVALVVLWLNYVPGTWGSKMFGQNVMPKDMVKPYVQKVSEVFDRFHPIYVISGDTDFDTEEAVEYYRIALKELIKLSPHTLKSMHIKRGYDYIPEEFVDKLDFYMFQSGHNADLQDMSYKLAQGMYQKYPPKPIINAEPCYEQMGFSRQAYGRFDRYDLRKAAWSSLLSGASAGITYGAHGIWNCHKINAPKNPILGEGFDEALPWEEALRLMGAWDYGFIRYLFEENDITSIEPVSELINNATDEIRMGKSDNGIYIIYVPSNTNLVLRLDLSEYRIKTIDLDKKNIAYPKVAVKDNQTIIEMHRFERDVLVIAKK